MIAMQIILTVLMIASIILDLYLGKIKLFPDIVFMPLALHFIWKGSTGLFQAVHPWVVVSMLAAYAPYVAIAGVRMFLEHKAGRT